MADLPNFADRMEDTEIAANAPITETLMRKFGSNINFILDFLGVTDGSTSPSGSLSDLSQAVDTADNHIMDLQVTLPKGTAGFTNVGTFSREKFLNQVFYLSVQNSTTLLYNGSVNWDGLNSYLAVSFDGGSKIRQNIPVSQFNSPDFAYTDNRLSLPGGDNSSSSRSFSQLVNPGTHAFTIGEVGFNPPFREFLLPLGVVDWRDYNTNFDLDIFISVPGVGNFDDYKIYRAYQLNVGSGTGY